jgi:2-polyprenyl-6-methoxyphenol hydroxylase-like FAD-dependent oxidoreductase
VHYQGGHCIFGLLKGGGAVVHVAIIGAGPAGLLLGAGLARRGANVTLVDRDPGPPPAGRWARRGVMQFHHAHVIRPQAVATLQRELPDAYQRLLDVGAEPVGSPRPDGTLSLAGLRCQRSTYERAVRKATEAVRGVTVQTGHVDQVVESGDGAGRRVVGLVVDGAPLGSDLVVDASGRSGRVNRHRRAPQSAGGVCGIAYVDRVYQLHEGAEPGPLVNPIAWQANFDGYQCLVFLHERGIFSALVIRSTDARDLVGLRHNAAFDAAVRAIPGLADWTDPGRSRPLTDVLPGGTLLNAYRSQRGPEGELALPGLLFVGDAVCTTTPNFGRGLATTMLQVDEVLRLLDATVDMAGAATTSQLSDVGEAFDAWTEARMRPWVEDHAVMDEALRRRWAGDDVDLTGPRLPSDLVLEAAKVDERIGPAVGPYMGMQDLPSVLDPVEPLARVVYQSGWRPALTAGPNRRELAEIVDAAAA